MRNPLGRLLSNHLLLKRTIIATVAAVSAIIWAGFWTKAHASERASTDSSLSTQPASLAIDEGLFVDINGTQQWITIRGQSLDNPVILFLHGGPGMALSGIAPLFSEWEKHYTLVQWDQPNSGATHIKNMQTGQGPLTVERYVRDGLAVTKFAQQRLKKDKVVLFGMSWGSMLGLEMIKKSPELFSAYVGTAQVVSGPEGDRIGYELALQAARARNDRNAIAALEKAAPPFTSMETFLVRQQYSNPPGMPASAAEQAATAGFIKTISAPPPSDARYNAYKSLPPGFNGAKMFMDALQGVFVESRNWEARNLGSKFETPVFVFQGDNDLNTPASLAKKYVEEIGAPMKRFELIEGVGHNTLVFHAELLELLNTHVRPVLGQ